ncbi:metalloregulator ArsR/SmtB family transcription factor [Acetobacter estunensis]|uniref:Metalloregulator ArsR/SmtB family transcription factor n=1 Tax=Acetobacter musti TaxID=864732 RepID=A0ABX0JV74_9PROT|nr:metalloregulator ArsR/SmtB family transcription factor [Acetobacter estunensis]NHN86719.1 metalloregulator ArsR/SmtB family transcription factor [Acetobacter musti]NHO20497.1 metalloregulator ArsR/SmtB family transcription factor [Acetobacter oeni]
MDAVDFLKHFTHTNRLLIVCSLVEAERSVGELETVLGIRQPTLSQQLGELREAGIIEGRREAKQVFYRIADARSLTLISMLHDRFCGGELAESATEQGGAASTSHTGSADTSPRRIIRSAEAARFARIELPRSSDRDRV